MFCFIVLYDMIRIKLTEQDFCFYETPSFVLILNYIKLCLNFFVFCNNLLELIVKNWTILILLQYVRICEKYKKQHIVLTFIET